MDETKTYYRVNASAFFDGTVHVDMAPVRDRFLRHLPPGGHVLDAGCGSGRDAKAFAALGYTVSAFDASPELATLAAQHCGLEVHTRTFADVDEVARYDGIWCCASLLHVPMTDMATTLAALWNALRPGGALYVSFKHGQTERVVDGRRFTDADEPLIRHWFAAMSDAEAFDFWLSADQRPGRAEQWTNAVIRKASETPRRLVTGESDHFLPHLSAALATATGVDLAVAFVKTTGLRLLLPDLEAALTRNGPGSVRILTSDYLDITDPSALRLLGLLQQQGAEVRVFVCGDRSFHLKAYIFSRRVEGALVRGTAFIGSSNISGQALREGLEWNYRVTHPGDGGFVEALDRFEKLFAHERSVALSDAWIEAYEQRRLPPSRSVAPGSHEQEAPPEPNAIQKAALEALERTRQQGFCRGLVVLATGLGKTWLAAFDVARSGARRVLFVAHREEILAQAAKTFVRIRPHARVGIYAGGSHDAEVDVLCASVQTLARAPHLARFAAQHFDYVVVDEFHHAAASTYRRLLGHFAPTFLLGLTATPDRTDQSDILSLCDDNLVYTCHLFEGIQAGLLAPFHYYGIADESVDYREVPWRNGRFDPEALSNKLATLARARHALKEWRQRAQRRTLAFCVSIRHAEYMADQFNRAGVASVAVYAGSTTGRAEALEQLDAGRLQVLFTVDLFNEGVDLPSIDTVLMLRPTESKILFLQQLGRGLRRSEGKTHLVVLDFLGNHQAFLQKPQALFNVGATYKALAGFARRVEDQTLDLPEGCYVNYDLTLIDFLKALDSSGPQNDYEALRDAFGRRPTLLEFYRGGGSVPAVRRQYGSWFEFVQSMGGLEAEAAPWASQFKALLQEVESTAMTKSFKMVLLEAFLELDGLRSPCPLPRLNERSKAVLMRRRTLLVDLTAEMRSADGHSEEWARYWRDNPVKAWTGGNLKPGSAALFKVVEGRFQITAEVPEAATPALAEWLQELVDYRLATYEVRTQADDAMTAGQVVPLRRPSIDAVELPYFPNLKIACGHFRAGRTDSEEHRPLPSRYGTLDPSRHFIARASGRSMDGGKHPIRDGDALLLELISPANAGSITGQVVAIERQDPAGGDSQYLLRVVTKQPDGRYVLKAQNPAYADLDATDDMRTLARFKAIVDPLDLAIGQSFMREDIPALFGETFNPGNWHLGHVFLGDQRAHILLVTLSKQGKAEEHQYVDQWVDDHTFHWQSQNTTTPDSKRGRELIQHQAMGMRVHLFVRKSKLAGTKAAPFVYQGDAYYRSHQGSAPMSVLFNVPQAVP